MALFCTLLRLRIRCKQLRRRHVEVCHCTDLVVYIVTSGGDDDDDCNDDYDDDDEENIRIRTVNITWKA